MLKPVRTVAPAVDLVTAAEVKAQCRIDTSDDDTLIAALIAAATSYVDGYSGILGRALVNQTWAQKFPSFPGGAVLGLPLAPVQSITSITYYDSDNASQTLASSVYALLDDELGPHVALQVDQSWPSAYSRADAVTVTFVAGYGAAASAVPAAIRHAALMLIANWYENRQTVVVGAVVLPLPFSVAALLAPFRRWR